MPVRPAIIPCLLYDHAPAAIEFLCRGFGFARHAVHASDDGSHVHHAQLTLNGTMLMVSSASPEGRSEFGTVTPRQAQGLVTGGLYVVIHDADSHHAVAAREGARILVSPHDNDYGGRSYETHDCEGYFWSFGTYDPFA